MVQTSEVSENKIVSQKDNNFEVVTCSTPEHLYTGLYLNPNSQLCGLDQLETVAEKTRQMPKYFIVGCSLDSQQSLLMP